MIDESPRLGVDRQRSELANDLPRIPRGQQVDGRLLIAIGSSISVAVSAGISACSKPEIVAGIGPIDLLKLPDDKDHLVRTAAAVLTSELQRRDPETAIRYRTDATLRSSPSRRWLDVPAPIGAERFATVRVPSWWRDAERLCLVSRLPGRTASPRSRPMTVFSTLAHRRQRWAARLSTDRAALNAELASPWRPRLVVLAGTYRGRRLALFAHDLIAAELAWLALAGLSTSGQAIGPWEDPAVQRAAAMDLGVALPSQLLISATPASNADLLGQQLAAALGIDRPISS